MSLTSRTSHTAPLSNAASPGGPCPLAYRRIVVKAGTAILTEASGSDGSGGVNLTVLGSIVRQLCQLREQGAEVMLVTSGAIAAGRAALGRRGPVSRDIRSRQVAAAVGQSRLMQIYQEQFGQHGVTVAQALLTIGDLSNRQSYLNVRNTLYGLLELGVVPLLNENDVVAVDEIGAVFGDNDRLSALVANLVDADLLLILTDIDGLYTADPRVDPSATLIPRVERVDERIEAAAGQQLQPWARGGMPTKLDAARLVTTSGIPMIMAHGRDDGVALRAAYGEPVGTFFQAAEEKLEARKRWMLSGISQRGQVTVDDGAVAALTEHHRSLLPAGVRRADGGFARGDTVFIADGSGRRIACGIANYSAEDVQRIRGLRSGKIEETLGYHYGQEVVHRNNLVLL
jgi:glutamate 5-kinase